MIEPRLSIISNRTVGGNNTEYFKKGNVLLYIYTFILE